MKSDLKKQIVDSWFSFLQSQICKEFENLEDGRKKFVKRNWTKNKKKEGGGTALLLTNGNVFEKVGVAKSNGKYWASGISVVAHMKNPKIPAIHFNTRFIVTSKEWFGGGMDVTPSFKDNREKALVHEMLKKVCFQNQKNYSKYKLWCDEYFYLPHRKEIRGIGGIFFDYETKNWVKNFKFIKELGYTFMDISKKIINRKKGSKWTKKDKEKQLIKRGRYVEFNLLYDRGTKFGLNSGGNIQSIFMSLPPEAKWK